MNRLLLISVLLLIAIIAAEKYINHNTEAQRILKSQLRKLPGNAGKTGALVHELKIESADTAWTYRLKQGNWHYPANENAFAHNDRIKSFLKDVVESYGTIVATSENSGFGFESGALTVHLVDSSKTWTQKVLVGASLPGTDTREAYMKTLQSDTIFHIHSDPRRGLHWERRPNSPPFIDPKVLPSALQRRGIKRIVFVGHSIQELERVEIEPEEDKQSPTDGPTYEWYAIQANNRQKIVNASAYAFISFVSRIKYSAIHNPDNFPQTNRYLVLIDDQDTADTLDVASHTTEFSYLRHRTTGHLYSIAKTKSDLLFPTPTLLDTLPDPSPYQIAEPTGPFSLASP